MRYSFLIAILGFLFLFLSKPLQAANDPPLAVGARVIALGGAYQGMRGDYWSLFHNPAGIAGIDSMAAGLYFVRRFNLKELTTGSAGLVMPFLQGDHSLGIDFSTFGFAAYRENRIGVTYATTLLEKVSIGAKLNYASLSIPGYGNTNSLFVDVGLQALISPQLSIGFSATNVNRAKLGQDPAAEALPTAVTTGLAYRPSDRVLLLIDVQKDIDHPVSLRGGVAYHLNDMFIARLGMSSEPLSWHAGLGLVVEGLQIDFAYGYTDKLGYSPHISLNYAF